MYISLLFLTVILLVIIYLFIYISYKRDEKKLKDINNIV